MQEDTARDLVKNTLQSSFNKEDFTKLTKNIFNHIEDKSFTYHGSYIYDDFSDSVRLFERIGKYKDPNEKLIDILIVHLKGETSLERARTKQRNFAAKYLKGRRGGILRDAALVAFVAPNGNDWRFSFVKMEYKFNEKGKVVEEFTPARRYSFLVGKNEACHTAQSCLIDLLRNDEEDPTLEQLEKAFSVEPVTKEFFKHYELLYGRMKSALDEHLTKNKIAKKEFKNKVIKTEDFSKRLLGQIVFLYFLQKKGWLGVAKGEQWGSGPKDFLRRLYDKECAHYVNFFNDILEPLFYEALATERTDNFYQRFNCHIPFLNGGLFEPIHDYDWVHTDILLGNNLFEKVFKVFNQYNFTVCEDEPLEKEVAVDPEMLGKVFENLIPENERKGSGTYYTPREIVHYMCQESLANYLTTELSGKVSNEDIERLIKHGKETVENEKRVVNKGGRKTKSYSFRMPKSIRQHAALIDKKLSKIRVCDPAIGSGAFPVGMMGEIVNTRNALTSYIGESKGRSSYDFKRHAIQASIYGVDIEPSAVDIAKLRLWLSLVVDEDDFDTIKPLPNLDYKIVQGNSLLRKV